MRALLICLPVLALSCQEYDLSRKTGGDNPNPVDTGDPDTTAPDIEVDPASLDFGYVMKDCPSTPQTVTISNVGSATLEVTSIAVDGAGAGSWSHDGASFSLAAGESRTVEVTFTPTAWVTYDVELVVESNDPDEARVAVPMEGIGAEDAYYEQTWLQPEPGPVDVLWVVDNSGSMSSEIQRVKDNFESFVGEFLALGLDFHMGAITTDMDFPDASGKLQGTPRWIDASTPNPEDAFRAVIDDIYSVTGSGSEKGLDAVKAALSEPLVSGYNAGFMRDYLDGEEVAVYSIIVTDENDSSSTSPSAFASWYNGLKDDSANATLTAICGDPPSGTNYFGGCMEWVGLDVLEAEAGTDYTDAAALTGGNWTSICTTDFSEALQYLSLEAMGLTAIFELVHEPTSIALTTVKVDGVAVTYSAVEGWSYDSDRVAIVFHGDSIPGPGATIWIQYPYDGGC